MINFLEFSMKLSKKIKGKNLPSKVLVNTKDVEISPLHVIFDLKWVLVGKEYFNFNDLLPLLFKLVWGHTLLG